MDAVILFSHGSLLCGAGQSLDEHAQRLREGGEFALVEVAYLNYSEPRFQTAVERCLAAGARRIAVVPYFLVPGVFVRNDLPREIDSARARHPEMEFAVADPIGFDERLALALVELADSARPGPAWREDLRQAPAFCQENPRCPLFGTAACPPTADRGVEAIPA